METTSNQQYLNYLFTLQTSGVTNMFGAATYLQRKFGLSSKESQDILGYWMENYEAIAKELGVEI